MPPPECFRAEVNIERLAMVRRYPVFIANR
jgi:hypothetical protein